jgi:hypothetical protein
MNATIASNKKVSYLNRFAYAFGFLAAIYTLTYIFLSANGQYQPQAESLHGVELSVWAPLGFYDPIHPWKGSLAAERSNTNIYGGWSLQMERLFWPLFLIDTKLIHKSK